DNGLSHLVNLISLDLNSGDSCSKNGLHGLTKLRILDLINCHKIFLSEITHLTYLTSISVFLKTNEASEVMCATQFKNLLFLGTMEDPPKDAHFIVIAHYLTWYTKFDFDNFRGFHDS